MSLSLPIGPKRTRGEWRVASENAEEGPLAALLPSPARYLLMWWAGRHRMGQNWEEKMLETDAAKILFGLVLIALSVGMVYVARVRDGRVNPLLQGANGQQ